MKRYAVWIAVGAAALVLGAGLFWHYRTPGENPPLPHIVAQNLQTGFIGERHFGSWTLRCRKRFLAEAQNARAFGVDTQALQQRTLSPKLSMHACIVSAVLRKGNSPANTVVANFVMRGANAPLLFVVRVPLGLVPLLRVRNSAAPSSGDTTSALDLSLNGIHAKLPIGRCHPLGCFAVARLSPSVEGKILNASSFALGLPAAPGQQQKTIEIPLNGMADAINALRSENQNSGTSG